MSSLVTYYPLLLQGAATTLAAWVLAGGISLFVGILLGIAGSQCFGLQRMGWLIRLYAFIAKGIPAYVHILIFYFVIPSLLHISVSGFMAATCALAFCSSGYVAEIIRGAVNAVPSGQWEACFVLGYSRRSTIMRIILPQALRIALPALLGELEQLIKSTSLLATIGVTELTRAGMNIVSYELTPLPVYMVIAAIYLFFSALLTAGMAIAEQRNGYVGRY